MTPRASRLRPGRVGAIAALAILPLLASGCIAAAIPVVAGGVIARERLKGGDAAQRRAARRAAKSREPGTLQTEAARAAVAAMSGTRAAAIAAGPLPPPGSAPATLSAASITTGALPPPGGAMPPPAAASLTTGTLPPPTAQPPLSALTPPGTTVDAAPVPPGAATGEEAAASLQAYQSLWNHLAAQAAKRSRGEPVGSVVLVPGATLDAPQFVPCGAKPLAIIVDLDENPARSSDPRARWRRWSGDGSDKVVAVQGAVEGVEAARRAGMTVIFTTARAPAGGPGIRALLDRLGFGTAEPGRTLMMRGGAADPSADDHVRTAIASSYCVVAIVGDALGEFSDRFDAAANRQSTMATETMVAPLWGAGWFLLPNPVRSTIDGTAEPNGDR